MIKFDVSLIASQTRKRLSRNSDNGILYVPGPILIVCSSVMMFFFLIVFTFFVERYAFIVINLLKITLCLLFQNPYEFIALNSLYFLIELIFICKWRKKNVFFLNSQINIFLSSTSNKTCDMVWYNELHIGSRFEKFLILIIS